MRNIFVILFIFVFGFAEEPKFVDPDVAFKTSAQKIGDSIYIKLELYKDIYLYDDKLKVLITKPKKIDITNEINKPKAKDYKGEQSIFESPLIKVPLKLIEEKVGKTDFELQLKFQGCSTEGICYAPMKEKWQFTEGGTLQKSIIKEEVKSDFNLGQKIVLKEVKTEKIETQSETGFITQSMKNGNVFLVLVTFFGFGLLLSFTPCVFPMIPILSSIIVNAGNKSEMTASRGFFLSLVYVLAMAAAYTIAGVIAGLFGANLQVALQNPIVLSVFSGIFIILAFSMFGYFRLELPQALQSKIHKSTEGKEKQGVFGIAVMGFLSALIVGPCIAPPLAGALVYIGQTGDALLGGAALFVLSMGMGVPLLLIGVGAGKFMPKPGGWMEGVSKIFGVLMLAIAIWMLDRVLPSVVTMYLWAILFLGSAIYAGVFEPIKENVRGEFKLVKLFALVLLLMGVILFVGAVSGATNPLNPLKKFTAVGNSSSSVSSTDTVKFTYVKNIKELDLAIKNSKKPVMLDFYADWCISCKELEFITFADAQVKQKLSEFTLLKADVTADNKDDKALLKRFNLFGPPGLIFWDKDGNEIKQAEVIGYKDPEDFLVHLNKYF